jgi:hypothetical protein
VDSSKRVKIASAKSTSAKHCGVGGHSAKRINISSAKSTSSKHCGSGDSASRINIVSANSTSSKHCGGGDSASFVAGDKGVAHSTNVDTCLPFWVMKTDGRPPTELNINSNNSWVDEEAFIRSRGSLSTAALARDLNLAINAPEGTNINNPIVISVPSKYCRATVDNQSSIAFACVDREQDAYKSRFDTDKENSCPPPNNINGSTMKHKKGMATSSHIDPLAKKFFAAKSTSRKVAPLSKTSLFAVSGTAVFKCTGCE